LYQAKLVNLVSPSGVIVAFPGLDENAVEFTMVAKIPVSIFYKGPLPGITSTFIMFNSLEGGEFYIYYDSAANSDVSEGYGFEDGDLVAFGNFYPNQSSNYLYDPSDNSGIGKLVYKGDVYYANPQYLNPNNIGKIEFTTTMNYPPIASHTKSFFDGVVFPVTEVSDSDIVVKSDGSSTFEYQQKVVSTCRVTAGGVKDEYTQECTLKQNGMPDPKTCALTFKDTWGGQAGAQPGVDGNWTHHHQESPQKSFVFHSNDVFWITCSDPGACQPASANADNHQIDFSGIGHFTNSKGYDPVDVPSGDLCYSVHLEDIGEPGPGGQWPLSTTPCDHCPGTPIGDEACTDCTDYYEIKIFDSAARDVTTGKCLGSLIYYNGSGPSEGCEMGDPTHVGYFIRSGNVQMHPENN